MDNPYLLSKNNTHHIDLNNLKRMCFELINIFYAHKHLVQNFEWSEILNEKELKSSEDLLFSLHREFAESEISRLLQQISLIVRIYDDVMINSEKTENINGLGACSDEPKFGLRKACNKIIHAATVRPTYERLDRTDTDIELDQAIWHLEGNIELEGQKELNKWDASIAVEPFIETILNRIIFGYPQKHDCSE